MFDLAPRVTTRRDLEFAAVVGAHHAGLVASALRLSLLTIAWNGVIGSAALGVAFVDGSLALAGFALNALLDSAASCVLVWRFRAERNDPIAAEHLERSAQALVALAMLVIGLYVGVQAVRGLAAGSRPTASAFGVGLAASSLLVLPWLGRRKLRVASGLPSPALRGDGILTIASAGLAAVALAALVANSVLGWWWADRVAGMLIGIALASEAVHIAATRRHR